MTTAWNGGESRSSMRSLRAALDSAGMWSGNISSIPASRWRLLGWSAMSGRAVFRRRRFRRFYLSSLRFSWTNQYLVVRSAIPAAALVQQVKAAIQSSNSEQAVFGVTTMQAMIADAVTEPKFHVFLIGVFALLAVAMAAAGMYSVISCLVSQRTSEIAIRITLGASHGSVVQTIMGTTAAWVVAGLACGLGLGLATRSTVRVLSSTAVQGSVWMYLAVLLLFFAVTLMAAYIPLRRAIRLDPSAALRCE